MQNGYWIVHIFILLFSVFQLLEAAEQKSDDVEELLSLYRKESDLSNKTKNESLGLLSVYTRDDLERMQAYTLSDLLNSLRSFRYDENMLGMPDVMHADPSVYSSDVVKIFVNDHEITSAYAGSGLYVYGNIDLGFVDHVEIYEGSASSYVSTGLAIVTIKLYTKEPSRELGGHLQGVAGSRGSYYTNASYAGLEDELRYFAYASARSVNRKKEYNKGYALTRDYSDRHVLTTLGYKRLQVDAEVLEHTMDPFLSLSMFATPKEGDIDYSLKRIGLTQRFLDDDSLKLYLSFVRIEATMDLSMDGTSWTANSADLLLPSDTFYSTSTDDTYNAKLEKTLMLAKHRLLMGGEYAKRDLHDVQTYEGGILDTTPAYVDDDIYSVYLQDDWLFSENQMLTASVKYNYYKSESDKNKENFDTTQLRIGYIYTDETNVFKIFASQIDLPTQRHMLSFSQNDGIEFLRITELSSQYTKQFSKSKVSLCYEFIQNQNPSYLIERDGLPDYYNNYSVALKYEHTFDPFNNVKSMVYYNSYYHPVTTAVNRVVGGFVRFLNSWRRFDFYNEADYYHVKDSAIDGVNFSAGVRYKASRSLVLSLKGTNIFNSAAKSEYLYVKSIDTSTNPPSLEFGHLYATPIEQMFTIGMEYSF